jgi:diketogulonate reductase-like aldo/keto reductase
MEYKKLGASYTQLPAIGLGTWNYAGGVGPLRTGIEKGARFIDTAEIYGTEGIVGDAVRDCRETVFIATKVAPRHFRRQQLIAAAEASLRRLGTDYIDLYQLHWPNYTVPIEEPMSAMEHLVDDGKIRFIGVSNFSIKELKAAQSALSRHKIVSNQVRYSLIDRTIEAGLLQYCQRKDITIIAYSPLGTVFSHIRARDRDGVLARVAATCDKTEQQVALNWLIAKPNVLVIPKASSISHVAENSVASGWRLSAANYALLDTKIPYESYGRTSSILRQWKRRIAQRLGRQL